MLILLREGEWGKEKNQRYWSSASWLPLGKAKRNFSLLKNCYKVWTLYHGDTKIVFLPRNIFQLGWKPKTPLVILLLDLFLMVLLLCGNDPERMSRKSVGKGRVQRKKYRKWRRELPKQCLSKGQHTSILPLLLGIPSLATMPCLGWTKTVLPLMLRKMALSHI